MQRIKNTRSLPGFCNAVNIENQMILPIFSSEDPGKKGTRDRQVDSCQVEPSLADGPFCLCYECHRREDSNVKMNVQRVLRSPDELEGCPAGCGCGDSLH